MKRAAETLNFLTDGRSGDWTALSGAGFEIFQSAHFQVNGTEYTMPQKMTTLAYMHYIKLRDEIMQTEESRRLYTYDQFIEMMDVIVELYGTQFTREDLISGMQPEDIIMEFAMMDVSVAQKVDVKVEKFKENFTDGE